ncbi:MAG: EamA family transporter [Candidatus Delongbacteria bacterium]
MLIYYIIFMCGVVSSVVAQIFLKRSSQNHNSGFVDEYLNKTVLTGYFIFFFAAGCIIAGYKEIPLKYGQVINSTGFIFLTFISSKVFGEKITKNKITGISLIILGIIIFFI